MERSPATTLRIGDWCVNPTSGQISRNGEVLRLEVRTMRLLLCLAEHAGEVVSIDDLLNQVWPEVTVSPDSVYQAVASLRRQLGDDPKQPAYIETVPRLGYRMVAKISPWTDDSTSRAGDSNVSEFKPLAGAGALITGRAMTPRILWAATAAICVGMIASYLVYGKLGKNAGSASSAAAPQLERSIAVLPFLDLTEHMAEEEFADGMTEELIDKFTKIPGLRVTPPTSSFYYRNKQIPLAEIAKSLGVSYVLDGSVRKSGNQVRIAARLIRADSGYVVWSETYDRDFDDVLMIQDDIAGKVTQALRTSIESAPDTVLTP
jgi:transcriptional activator of cad operon